MPKYKTAAQLGILPEERAGLIAFCESPTVGRMVAINGRYHYYDQSSVDDEDAADRNECGTAGCVGGYVFAHAKHIQKKRRLRGAEDADGYVYAAVDWNDSRGEPEAPLLGGLYNEGKEWKLSAARRVVSRMLRTGKVDWR